nr:efflux RND transporter periplasmic adaptor subunit [Actinomycetota bacterium]NIW29963.1 efflux RND transporter periplasmic adaptor subunit [Actinomycetota bacterium]NIX22456.1 efflux RND transporter periplasmic adaptor subunit [Actinomycetota bacterium]
GHAERLEIDPGRVLGDRIEVNAADLAAGDRVAVLGHTALTDGDAVEVF